MYDAIADEFSRIFDPETIASTIAEWLPRLTLAALTLVSFWLLWKVVERALARLGSRSVLDETAMAFVSTAAKYVLLAMGVVSALGRVGIDTTSVLASLGIAGLSLGFAARDTLSNIISGIFIFWDRPFVIGDLVEIDGHYGRVETITMRSTRVVTVDGRMLAIPNSAVANGTVVSYTNFPNLRIDVPVTVGVGENLGRVRALLTAMAAAHPAALESRPPVVVVTELGDYNVTVELRTWIVDERAHVAVRAELREHAFECLRDAGVDMPYETLVVRGGAEGALAA